jgi:hypothetical protein
VDGTSLESCQMARLGVKGVEPAGSTTIVLRMVRWRGHVARMPQMNNSHSILVRKPVHGRDHLGNLGI